MISKHSSDLKIPIYYYIFYVILIYPVIALTLTPVTFVPIELAFTLYFRLFEPILAALPPWMMFPAYFILQFILSLLLSAIIQLHLGYFPKRFPLMSLIFIFIFFIVFTWAMASFSFSPL